MRNPSHSLLSVATLAILLILLLSAMHTECKAQRKHKPPKHCDSISNEANNCTTATATSPTTSNSTAEVVGSTTTAPSTTSARSIIAKTTDVIYNAFNSVFSHHPATNSTTQASLNVTSSTSTTPAPNPTSTETSTPATATESEEPSTTTRRSRNKKKKNSKTTTTEPPTTTTTTSIPTTTELDTIDSLLDEQMSTTTPISNDNLLLESSTLAPTEVFDTTTNAPTPPTGAPSAPLGGLAANLTGLIGNLIKSLDSLKETQANRSTRLAPEADFGDFALHSGKLVVAPDNQPATNEDVHLLCKLLQRHLGSANLTSLTSALATPTVTSTTIAPIIMTTRTSMASNSSSSPTPTTTSTSTTTTPKPQTTTAKPSTSEKELFVSDADKLNETIHGSYLLESIFNFRENPPQGSNSTRRSAERLLTELYNAAADTKRLLETVDYDGETGGGTQTGNTMLVRDSSRFARHQQEVEGDTSNQHLHYVYWLLEKSDRRLRLVGAREANELLDRLEHRLIERQLELSKVFMATDFLVAPFNSTLSSWNSSDQHKHERQPPRIIDDTLSPVSARPKASASGLQLLLDKFTQTSFMDNLQIYLAIFILATLVIILCLAVPLMCCCARKPAAGAPVERRPSKGSGAGARRQRERRRPAAGAQAVGEDPPPGAGIRATELDKSSDSIWRKLSSSTTTLVKDESHEIRADGTVGVPVIKEHQVLRRETDAEGDSGGKKHQFEWYSFEDRLEEVVTRTKGNRPGDYSVASSRRLNELSSSEKRSSELATVEDLLLLDFRNRQEARNSDTLTKSELVMLKEKLVPIARLERAVSTSHQQQAAATQTTSQESSVGDYVNCPKSPVCGGKTANKLSQTSINDDQQQQHHSQPSSATSSSSQTTRRGGPRSSLASHYIDSTEPSCSLATGLATASAGQQQQQHERQAKMRHVELPARTRSKVELIRAELDRLEQADREKQQQQQQEITYKRYEI